MSVEQTPEDRIHARELISKIPPDVLKNLRPFASLSLTLHTGVDRFGRRLTPQEREILKKSQKRLIEKIAKKHEIYRGKYGSHRLEQEYHLNDMSVLRELAGENQDNSSK